jgi:ATP-dependent Clp endopeptidase proteolytic subunit ClpP
MLTWTQNTQRLGSDSDPSTDENESKDRVETMNNRIYFYSEVNRAKILTLNKKITSLNISLLNQVNTLGLESCPTGIQLYINSYGGSVFAGMSAVDYIKSSQIPVTSVIDGCAASAATLMSVVAKKRLMREHSFMLIHQLSSISWGKFEELKDEMTNNELLMRTITDIYTQYTRIPKKKLKEMLKRDLWWDAKTCLEYGLIDDII